MANPGVLSGEDLSGQANEVCSGDCENAMRKSDVVSISMSVSEELGSETVDSVLSPLERICEEATAVEVCIATSPWLLAPEQRSFFCSSD